MTLTDFNRRFSTSILIKLLIEDHRTFHAKRFNNNDKKPELVVGDIVMAKTTIQSDATVNKAAKLSYQVRGPFCIVKCTSRGFSLIRNLYKPDSP